MPNRQGRHREGQGGDAWWEDLQIPAVVEAQPLQIQAVQQLPNPWRELFKVPFTKPHFHLSGRTLSVVTGRTVLIILQFSQRRLQLGNDIHYNFTCFTQRSSISFW